MVKGKLGKTLRSFKILWIWLQTSWLLKEGRYVLRLFVLHTLGSYISWRWNEKVNWCSEVQLETVIMWKVNTIVVPVLIGNWNQSSKIPTDSLACRIFPEYPTAWFDPAKNIANKFYNTSSWMCCLISHGLMQKISGLSINKIIILSWNKAVIKIWSQLCTVADFYILPDISDIWPHIWNSRPKILMSGRGLSLDL